MVIKNLAKRVLQVTNLAVDTYNFVLSGNEADFLSQVNQAVQDAFEAVEAIAAHK